MFLIQAMIYINVPGRTQFRYIPSIAEEYINNSSFVVDQFLLTRNLDFNKYFFSILTTLQDCAAI